MDEYIKREDVISAMCFGCNQQFSDEPCEPTECALRQAIKAVPTADVVPKSEVERLQGALKAEELHNELTMEMAKKAISNAKAEVAREIFEEIERVIAEKFNKSDFKDNRFDDISKDAISLFIGIVSDNFAEIKKKYIPKDCRDCRYFVGCECFSGMTCNMYEEKET